MQNNHRPRAAYNDLQLHRRRQIQMLQQLGVVGTRPAVPFELLAAMPLPYMPRSAAAVNRSFNEMPAHRMLNRADDCTAPFPPNLQAAAIWENNLRLHAQLRDEALTLFSRRQPHPGQFPNAGFGHPLRSDELPDPQRTIIGLPFATVPNSPNTAIGGDPPFAALPDHRKSWHSFQIEPSRMLPVRPDEIVQVSPRKSQPALDIGKKSSPAKKRKRLHAPRRVVGSSFSAQKVPLSNLGSGSTPLPALDAKEIRKTRVELNSYHQYWQAIKTSSIRKEVFARRLHSNSIPILRSSQARSTGNRRSRGLR